MGWDLQPGGSHSISVKLPPPPGQYSSSKKNRGGITPREATGHSLFWSLSCLSQHFLSSSYRASSLTEKPAGTSASSILHVISQQGHRACLQHPSRTGASHWDGCCLCWGQQQTCVGPKPFCMVLWVQADGSGRLRTQTGASTSPVPMLGPMVWSGQARHTSIVVSRTS